MTGLRNYGDEALNPVPTLLDPTIDASEITFLQSGTGAVARTVQAEFRDVYKPQQIGALGDGATNDGAAINQALVNVGSGVLEFPPTTYLTSALTAAAFSKINGNGAILKPSANSMTVLALIASAGFGALQDLHVRDLKIDGSGKTGITGIKAPTALSNGVNGFSFDNIVAYGCDTVGLDFQNAQFISTYRCRATRGTAGCGVLIKNFATEGGGNSHDHYFLEATYATVGIVVNGTNFATGCASLNFYNPQILNDSVCGMAFFDANATVYGGAPENNGTGAATATVDGKTVKRASMYLNNSTVRIENMNNGEAVADPCFLLEINSTLTLKNATGYGSASGKLVSADAGSVVVLEGSYSCVGIVQNVVSWPQLLAVQTGKQILYGEPVNSIDSSFTALYADQAPALAPAGVNLPIGSYVEDADLGYCRQIVFAAATGTVSDNHADIPVGAGAASKDTVFTILCKASADCLLGVNTYNGTGYDDIGYTAIALKSGKVTRIVMTKSGIAANGTWYFVCYAGDATAPTIKFARLQVYQGTTGTIGTKADVAKIVQYGAFNPGVIRDTQANLRDKIAAVNILNKFPGKQVWDTTNNRVVFAAGRADTDIWKDGVNTTVHTPV